MLAHAQFRLVVAVMLCAVASSNLPAGAAEEAEEPAMFPVHTIPMPGGIAPIFDFRQPLPAPDASEALWVERVRTDTALFRTIIASAGILLPEHSAALIDPVNQCLALRTTMDSMEVVEASLYEFVTMAPENLVVSFESYRVDGATARNLALETATQADASAALSRVEELAKTGAAQRLVPIRVETRSGNSTRANSGGESQRVTRVAMDAKGNVFTQTTPRPRGDWVEFDPVLGPDRQTLDLNLALQRTFGTPTPRTLFLGHAAGKRIEILVSEGGMGKLIGYPTIIDGMTELLSIWPVGDAWSKDGHEVTFLRADVVRVLPERSNTAEQMLRAYADQAVGKPPEFEVLPVADDGMKTRKFQVPAPFLFPRITNWPDDPGPPIRPQLARRETALEILKRHGIPFPPGASATYLAPTSTLIVRNTEPHHDMVAAFLKGEPTRAPDCIQVTLFIAEMEAVAGREMMEATTKVADHTAAFKNVEKLATEGRARIPVVLRYLKRSGQVAWVSSAVGHACAEQLSRKEQPRRDVPAPGDTMRTAGTIPPWLGMVGAEIRDRDVGTMLKSDGVIDPDGRTVDLVIEFEHHFAPPSLLTTAAGDAGEGQAVAPPNLKFHCAKVNVALSLDSGSMKLLGVWEPAGAPGFEGKDVMQVAFLRVDVVPVEKK